MVKPLTVYKASAGSGKTFALAVHYIQLVVQNPMSYRNILAVTFTNKATEEMKTRILSQLYGIWKQLPDSTDYMKEVCKSLDVSPDFASKRAGQALALLLHNYNQFRVMTIDTFFQNVLRNLARELDLTTNLRIGLNDTQVEEMAVDQLINELQATDKILQWILKYIMENISDDHSWNVIGQIKQFGETIFRDYYKDISKDLNEQIKHENFFNLYTNKLREIKNSSKTCMIDIATSFFEVLDAEGLTVDDLANKKRGIAGFFYKLQNGLFDESIENATVSNCLGDPTKWYANNHPRRELIHNLADGELGEILRHAVNVRPQQWKLYQSATLTLRHLNQVRLLSSIENKVRELNENANRFLLSDTQKLLNALISDSDSPFIYEKIGTQLEHVLIDEFQDTSIIQWQNFKVLLNDTMSRTGSENLIVGDVKQSIYRWRSGDWRLLNDIEKEFSQEMLHTEPLKMNRRSARNIILFNNSFFAEAARIEHEQLSDSPEAEQLQRAYAEVRQEIPDNKPNTGYVRIELLPADNYQEQTLLRIAETIETLCQQGIPQYKMAILVRTNSYIPLIANYFACRHPNIAIVSDEAFRLDASRPVNIIIRALRLLTNPDDVLSLAYLQKTIGNMQCFMECRSQLSTIPLYELIEQLFTLFNLDRFDDQSAYICSFFDQLRLYCTDNPATIADFLHQWDDDICSKTIQIDANDGVRIISIHKSKGLEFEHIIIPFCDWQLEKTGKVLWCHPHEAPFNELSIVPIDYSKKSMAGTIYEADYHHEHLQNVVDNLNLLYVAFTRARSSLFVLGRRNAKNSRSEIICQVFESKTFKSNIQAQISGQEDERQPLLFEYGKMVKPQENSKSFTINKTENVFLQPSTLLPVKVTSYPAKTEFRQSNLSRSFIAGDDEQDKNYIQLGKVLHYVFSTIRTTDDIQDALRLLEQEGILYDHKNTLERITTMLRRRLEHPKVAEWFSKRWTLFNECTILNLEQGNVTQRRPDRVMTDGQEWIVVDFKFGHPCDDHYDQVREYMQLIKSMGYTSIHGYLWYVYSNKIVEVK